MNRQQLILLYLFLPLLIDGATPAVASLTLLSNAPPGEPVVVSAGATSEEITVSLVNDSASDAAEDFLTGWQVSLLIQPEVGATGQVMFNNPSGPVAAEPRDYLLEGVNFGISVTNTGEELSAFDFNLPFSGGAQVPTDPGATLFSFDLSTSSDAFGRFHIFAVDTRDSTAPARLTEWTDAMQVIQRRRAFANVPLGLGAVQIATVRVVPEPNTAILGFGIFVGILAAQRWPRTRLERLIRQ